MVKICSKCLIEKDNLEFYYRNDIGKLRDQCTQCWKYRCSATRLGISFDEAKEYYRQPKCMCCGESFTTKKDHHLHHINHKVHGVICHFCNIALEQEKPETFDRLKACLEFMSKPRKNLFDRVNQQGRTNEGSLSFPSTIKRRIPSGHRQCKFCARVLLLNNFYSRKYKSGKRGYHTACKNCYKIYVKTHKYKLTFEQVKILRDTIQCDCCGVEFDASTNHYIHHIDKTVLGVVCKKCNILLEQESKTTQRKLAACIQWSTR